MSVYEKFKSIEGDMSLIGLEKGDSEGGYFCTPIGAEVIGWETEGIHYCFIDGFGEMVFAVNPETAETEFVRPIAENFETFMRLILACKSTTALEQISGWTKEELERFIKNEDGDYVKERQKLLDRIQKVLEIEPMENPFDYVKSIQKEFDYKKLKFTAEYYDVLGLEMPGDSDLA